METLTSTFGDVFAAQNLLTLSHEEVTQHCYGEYNQFAALGAADLVARTLKNAFKQCGAQLKNAPGLHFCAGRAEALLAFSGNYVVLLVRGNCNGGFPAMQDCRRVKDLILKVVRARGIVASSRRIIDPCEVAYVTRARSWNILWALSHCTYTIYKHGAFVSNRCGDRPGGVGRLFAALGLTRLASDFHKKGIRTAEDLARLSVGELKTTFKMKLCPALKFVQSVKLWQAGEEVFADVQFLSWCSPDVRCLAMHTKLAGPQ